MKKKRSRSRSPPKSLDPVLEARKKKFESNELKIKEGVIRLKPKNDEQQQQQQQEEEEEEECVLVMDEEVDDVIDVSVDDLFSDEETDNENEGRFKTGNANGSAKDRDTQKSTTTTASGGGNSGRSYQRLTTTTNKENKRRLMKKAQLSRLMVRSESKHKMAPPVSTLPEKKIEIKIRNPTKYEEKKELKAVVASSVVAAQPPARKVEIGPKVESGGEIVEECVDDEEEEVGDYDDEVVDLNEGECLLKECFYVF